MPCKKRKTKRPLSKEDTSHNTKMLHCHRVSIRTRYAWIKRATVMSFLMCTLVCLFVYLCKWCGIWNGFYWCVSTFQKQFNTMQRKRVKTLFFFSHHGSNGESYKKIQHWKLIWCFFSVRLFIPCVYIIFK